MVSVGMKTMMNPDRMSGYGTYGGARQQLVGPDTMATGGSRKMPTTAVMPREMVDLGRMMPSIPANPFFKEPARTAVMPTYGTYGGARQSISHPRFGFRTMLNQDSPAPLPTAPAVVGGNVNWEQSKITPTTQYLHSVLSVGRPMNPPPALGSVLRLGEPSRNSIHTTY